jgi:hypothetical protein
MIKTVITRQKTSCRSAVAYRDVGEGREQDAEASPARIAAGRPLLQVATGYPTRHEH